LREAADESAWGADVFDSKKLLHLEGVDEAAGAVVVG